MKAKRAPWQIGIHTFLAAILLPAVLLIIPASVFLLLTLGDINNAAESAARSYQPGFLSQQRALLNIEQLRHAAETVYSAESASIRRSAGLGALALASESSFAADAGFAEYVSAVPALIHGLSDAKTRSEQAAGQIHSAELRFREEITRLSIATGLDPLPYFARISSIRERELFEAHRADILQAMRPMRDACDEERGKPLPGENLLAVCGAVDQQWHKLDEAWNARTTADMEAGSLWEQLDAILRRLGDSVRDAAPALNYQDIQNIRMEAGAARAAALATALLLVAVSALIAFCMQRYVVSPIALSMHNLYRIRHGDEAEAPPPVHIRELSSLLNQLPTMGRHLRELSLRSGQLEEEKDKYESLSYVDGLTGISNRRSFDRQLARESRGASLSILMIDVDMFKLYNDTLGHQAGDNALIAVAHAMQQALLRSTDRVFRYGGEEFTVILSDANEDAAMAVAARILITIRSLNIPHPSSTVAPILTVSIGVATRNVGDHMGDDELVTRADQALYQAKSTGRNRISVYQPGAPYAPKKPKDEGPIVPAKVFAKRRTHKGSAD